VRPNVHVPAAGARRAGLWRERPSQDHGLDARVFRGCLAPRGRPAYVLSMGDAINLADPGFEPTDEQLIGLSKRAFAGVKAKHDAVLAKLSAAIEVMSAKVLTDLAERQVARSKGA
jgi:hypothetical protein